MRNIYLIACVSQKADSKQKARDLYQSPLFKFSLAYAVKQQADQIYILSAKHHLLELDTEIEPYDVTLSSVPRSKKDKVKVLSAAERKAWGDTVIEQLAQVADLQKDTFVILAGDRYIKPIIKQLTHVQLPLKGIRFGKRLSYLKQELAK